MLIFLVLLLFWFLLSGRFNLEYLIVGSLIAGLLTALYLRMKVSRSASAGLPPLRLLLTGLQILGALLVALIRANLILAWSLWKRSLPVQPVTFTLPLPLENPGTRAFAANAITLTPGTLAVTLEEKQLVVHSLYPGQEQSLKKWSLLARLEEWEGGRRYVRHRG